MRARNSIIGLLVVALLSLEAGAQAPTPKRDGPDGFGRAKFGMSVEEVKKAYPKMEVLDRMLGAAVVSGPFVKRFLLPGMKHPGLAKPTDVELRFWKDRLWVAIVYFGDNPEAKVLEALRKQNGEPEPGSNSWTGRKSTVVFVPRQRWYSVGDNAITQEVQQLFMEEFRRKFSQQAPAAPPAPATPVDIQAATVPAAPTAPTSSAPTPSGAK